MEPHGVDFLLYDEQRWMPRELHLGLPRANGGLAYVRDVAPALQLVVPTSCEAARIALDLLLALARAARRGDITLLPCYLDVHNARIAALLAYVDHVPGRARAALLESVLDAPRVHVLDGDAFATLMGHACSTAPVMTCVGERRVHKLYSGPAFTAGAKELVLLDALDDLAYGGVDAPFPALLHVAVHEGEHESTLLLSETRLAGDHFDVVAFSPDLSNAQVRDICVQLSRALAQLEARGIVHNDLISQNVLVNIEPDGACRVAIIDFGNAGMLPLAGATCRTDRYNFQAPDLPDDAPLVDAVLARSPAHPHCQFYAPEMCRVNTADLGVPSTRADVWSAAFLIGGAAGRRCASRRWRSMLERTERNGCAALRVAPITRDGESVLYAPALQALLDACVACDPLARPSAAALADALAALAPEDYGACLAPPAMPPGVPPAMPPGVPPAMPMV